MLDPISFGGSGDRVDVTYGRVERSIGGPSMLAVEKRVSLSYSQSGLMGNLTSRWPLLAGFPGERLHLHGHRASCGSSRVS